MAKISVELNPAKKDSNFALWDNIAKPPRRGSSEVARGGAGGHGPQSRKMMMVGNGGSLTDCLIQSHKEYRI